VNASAQIDPEVVAAMVADGTPPGVAGPAPSLELLETMRSQPPRVPFDPTPAAGVQREELTVAGAEGAPNVRVRIYRPRRSSPEAAAGIVWIHGGGYVLGSYDIDQPFLDSLVAKTGCVAVSVDYRLAPETPYPGPVDDCFAALSFLHEQAGELGVDASRLAVGGFSECGGLQSEIEVHDHPEEELCYIHQGKGIMTVEGKTYEIVAPVVLKIPANVRHGLQVTGTETLLKLNAHSPPRTQALKKR